MTQAVTPAMRKLRSRIPVTFRHSWAVASVLLLLALLPGVLGYWAFAGLSWIDALLNASMILTGMGPVAVLSTTGAKLFASAYALFSGIVFLSTAAVIVAPIIHHVLHRFHVEQGRN